MVLLLDWQNTMSFPELHCRNPILLTNCNALIALGLLKLLKNITVTTAAVILNMFHHRLWAQLKRWN